MCLSFQPLSLFGKACRQRGCGGLAVRHKLFKRVLLLLQRESSGADVQCLVGLNGGVFQRATPRASFAGLQG